MSLAAWRRRWPATTRSPWLTVECSGRQEPLQHGRLGLLDLEEQRIVVVTAEEQGDEGYEPDAPDAHDLQRDVRDLVPVEEDAPVLLQGLAIAGAAAITRSGVTSGRCVMIGGWSTIRRRPPRRPR